MKLTETKVQIKIRETTKLSEILFWNFLVTYIITLFLRHFLQTPNYINIVWLICLSAYMLSIRKHRRGGGTSPFDFNQTVDVINQSIKNKINN